MTQTAGANLYDRVGGPPTFVRLVDAFYAGVAQDAELRALYPEEDLTAANVRLRMFLEQYWGGPHTYSEQRGHPRLRMRHVPFTIGDEEREHWVRAMDEALEETLPEAPLDSDLRDEVGVRMREYFEMAATAMVNQAAR